MTQLLPVNQWNELRGFTNPSNGDFQTYSGWSYPAATIQLEYSGCNPMFADDMFIIPGLFRCSLTCDVMLLLSGGYASAEGENKTTSTNTVTRPRPSGSRCTFIEPSFAYISRALFAALRRRGRKSRLAWSLASRLP